ncbi:sensor histidine kinase mtrB domain protein [Mycobacterium avium subsp. avium 2285 (R)]|nr:sensor histidine kinase mtrB domain protein [Mycobacterium avium subsp. avium 2285 (R)]
MSRAVGTAWRRSLQLRVVALTLGLSLAVILALGFVLTSQVTNRVLDVKVKAAIEQIERARTTVGGIVNGEEARSLDSSLQLARNTLTSKTDSASGAGTAGTFDAVLMVPGDGPRAATTAGPVDQVPASLRGFVKAGQASYQYATVHTDGFSGPALIVGSPASSQVANLELYLIFPLKNEQATIQLVRGTMITGAPCCWCCWPGSRCWCRGRWWCRCVRHRASPNGSPRGICPSGCRCAARTTWPGWRCRSTTWPRACRGRSPNWRSSETCSAASLPT